MTKAIIYTRFSPRRNADESESCETQIHYCGAYCEAQGMSIIGAFRDEAISGKDQNRPGLQQALTAACNGKNCLVVYSLSRLARNTRDALEIAERIDKAGANLAAVRDKIDTTSPVGKFFFTIICAFNELERGQIRERTSDAMRRHQEAGRIMSSRLPYGYQRDPQDETMMIVDPAEMEVIDKILSMHNEGISVRGIGTRLMNSGIYCRGGKWHHFTIGRIIKKYGV